jgi:hypothetical protein
MAVCREKGWDWRNMEAYDAFIQHLRTDNLPMKPTPMKHPAKGFTASKTGTYIVRLDDAAIASIRSFDPKGRSAPS